MIIQILLFTSCFISTMHGMDHNNAFPQKTQQSKKFDQQVKRWEQQLYKASNEYNATRCKELLGTYPGTLGIKELEDLANSLKSSNIGTNIALIGVGVGVAGASVATLYCLTNAAIPLVGVSLCGFEYIIRGGYLNGGMTENLRCMKECLTISGSFFVKGLVSAGSVMGLGLYGAHLNTKKEKRKAVDAVFIEKLQELKDPCPQKEYVYNPETNSFLELKEHLSKASNKHNAPLCKELFGKYQGTWDIKQLEDLANSLKVSDVLLTGIIVGALVASGATAYFLFEACDNLLFAKELAYDYVSTPRGELEDVKKALKIGGTFAITGLATACPAVDLGLYGAHLYIKKEKHKPVDAVFIEKLKELQELQQQSKKH